MPDSARSGTHHGFADHDDLPASDEHLLTAVREGDTSAFGELFERHRGAALAVARMHSRNEADAQDLVSEAFTRVLGLLREGRGPREFLRAYLVTAVSRLAADRANDLSRTRPEDPQPEGPLDRVEFFDDVVVRQVDSAVVARAFASLPERWQEILWYLEVEGRRPRQVASVVGAAPNAVSALGKRAREGLRAAYMQEHVSAQALEDCHKYSSQLGAFARGSLTPSRTAVVQEHLDGCRRCTAEYLQLQDLGLSMRGWILPVLAGLPLWTGAGARLSDALANLPLWGAGTATVTAAAGTHAAGPAHAGSAQAASAPAGAAGQPVSVAGAGTASGGAGSSGGTAALAGTGSGWVMAGAALLVAAAAAVGIVAVAQGEETHPAVASSSGASSGAAGSATTGAGTPASGSTGDAAPRPDGTAAARDEAAPANSARPSDGRSAAAQKDDDAQGTTGAQGPAAAGAPAGNAAQNGTQRGAGDGSGNRGAASSGAGALGSPTSGTAVTPFLPGTTDPGTVPRTTPRTRLPVTTPSPGTPSTQVGTPTQQPTAEVPTVAVPTTVPPVVPDPGSQPQPSPSDGSCLVTIGSIGILCPPA